MTDQRADPAQTDAVPGGKVDWHEDCTGKDADRTPGADRPWTVSPDAVHLPAIIECTRDGAVATLWIARGTARNALPTAGWRELATAVASLAGSDVRAVILASRDPGIFCAGADIAEFIDLHRDPDRRTAFREALSAAIEGVAALPVPVIAAVDGGCFGAAVALVLACDMVVAGNAARFAVPPARLGILYPPADIARLCAAVGRGHAARLLFTGDAIDADEAQAIGLTHHHAAQALPAARAIASRIAANAPGAVRGLKLALNDVPGGDARFDAAFGGDELREGLAAFHGRRSPDFA